MTYKLGKWMGRIASIATAVALLLVLRLTSAPATISTDDLIVMALQFESQEPTRPLLSETARSRQISLTGFSMPELSQTVMGNVLTLGRADQLHVKDLYAPEKSFVRMALAGTSLTVLIDTGTQEYARSFVRIGVGDKVILRSTGADRHDADVSEGNVALTCDEPSCAMVLNLIDPAIKELVRPFDIGYLSLRVAGSDAESDSATQVSSIRGGKIRVAAKDLFGEPFAVRSLSLTSGDALLLDPKANGTVRIDTEKGHFRLSFSLDSGRHKFVSRVGDDINLAPSVLEILVREPWNKTLWGLALALIPMLIQITSFVRGKIVRNPEV